jgi:hypothetical protein
MSVAWMTSRTSLARMRGFFAAFREALRGPIRHAFDSRGYKNAIRECYDALAILNKYTAEK